MISKQPSFRLYPDAVYQPEDVERDSGGTPKALGAMLTLGGALGVLGAGPSELSRSQLTMAAAGSGICTALGLLVTRSPIPWVVAARKRPRAFAGAAYLAAGGSTALGGGHQTPAYFPAVLLTAVGASATPRSRDQATASLPGLGVAGAFLIASAVTRHRAGSLDRRGALVSAAHAAAFPAAAAIGALAGDASLRNRVLSDAVAREERNVKTSASKAEIEAVASAIAERSKDVLAVLAEIGESFSDDPSVGAATSSMATALSTLRGTRLRLDPVNESESLGGWDRLRAAIEEHNAREGDVQTVFRLGLDERQPVAAGTIGVLMDCAAALVQNAAEAASHAGRVANVWIDVDLAPGSSSRAGRREMVRMTVEDDAGGTDVPGDERWGGGLRTSAFQASVLGGSFEPGIGASGLRFTIELPWIGSRTTGSRAITFAREYANSIDRGIASMRVATSVQGALFAGGREHTRKAEIAATLLSVAIAEVVARLVPDPQRGFVEAALAVGEMGMWRGNERPALGGHASLLSAQIAYRGKLWPALGLAVAQTGVALVRAGEGRWSSDEDGTVADRIFPLICVGAGIGVHLGLKAVADEEERLGSEAWRRQLLFDLALPGRDDHHFLEPLIDALDEQSRSALEASKLGRALDDARQPLISAQFQLEQLMRRGEPLRDLQNQLARMFAPATVRVFGQPPLPRKPDEGHELEAVAYRIALVGLGLEIAEHVRRSLPRGSRLQELRLHVSEHGEETKIEVVQVPDEQSRDRLEAALDAAARRAGGRAWLDQNGHTVSVRRTAFW